jgi:hypothetical protein
VAGFDFHLPVSSFPPSASFCQPIRISEPDELWPLRGTPEPVFSNRGMTEAKCVFQFFHGRTTDEKLDALKHLVNICSLKANGRAYFSPKPYCKFVGAKTSRRDWENCDPYQPVLQKMATRGWFSTSLPEHISRYSPKHVTRRELLELARIKDKNLLHVCRALLCDLLNEASKQSKHEIHTATLWEHQGQESATCTSSRGPDYASAVAMLLKDKNLRTALPKAIQCTLELVFRKLDSDVEGSAIVGEVAQELGRDKRTIRRHLAEARDIATKGSDTQRQVMAVLASSLLTEDTPLGALATTTPPQVDVLAESTM